MNLREVADLASIDTLSVDSLRIALDNLILSEETLRNEIETLEVNVSTDSAATYNRVCAAEKALLQYGLSLTTLEHAATDLVSYSKRSASPFEELRKRSASAQDAATAIETLLIFAQAPDVSSLPSEIFHDSGRLGDVADAVQLVTQSIESVYDTDGDRTSPLDRGTMGNAVQLLELYVNILDNRIVANFDAGVMSNDVTAMAYYKSMMDRLHSGSNSILASRYVSQNAVFISPDKLVGSTSGSLDVGEMCARIREFLKHEILLIEQIFGSDDAPGVAELLVTRVFEETLADNLASRFEQLPREAKEDRENAIFICETSKKVRDLANSALQAFVQDHDALTAPELVEASMGPAIAMYEQIERRWHQDIGRSISMVPSPLSRSPRPGADRVATLSTDVVLDLISMNEESVRRCLHVKRQPSSLIQGLFCDDLRAPGGDTDSSLLDFVGTYVERQTSIIAEESTRSLSVSCIWTPGDPSGTPTSTSIDSVINASFGRVASCASIAAEIVELVKQHHVYIERHLDAADVATTHRALDGLQKAVEHHIATILQASVDVLALKMRDMLYLTQQKSYFLATEETRAATDQSPSCRKLCAIIVAVKDVVAKSLSPGNRDAFDRALCTRVKESLEERVRALRYTRIGGLRLKADLDAYAGCMGAKKGGLEELIALTNVLIVDDSSVNEVAHSLSYLGPDRVRLWIGCRAV